MTSYAALLSTGGRRVPTALLALSAIPAVAGRPSSARARRRVDSTVSWSEPESRNERVHACSGARKAVR